jgi:3-hydroxyacyl-CoA dehydrogenase/enoyl-CoA hydratase/3-hydroxybutyryl-CoA epimerase
MGSGIAWALSNAGVPVRMKDVDWEALGRGMGAAAAAFRAMVKRRKMTEGDMNLAMHRIGPTLDYTGFADADVVVEAVAEDLEVKRKVLSDIEACVRPDAIICTNTSSLPMAELADNLEHPQRFIGLHFFNPVNRMPLVEVVAEQRTSHETVVAATELVRMLGKTPMVVGACAGFLVNRILLPYLIESAWMFEEGADARRIDALLERFGMPMGPMALADEVGLDIGYKVAKVLEGAYGPRMQVPEALGAVAGTSDCLGKKTGSGFYVYRNGRKKPNRRVERLARQARRVDGVSARQLSDEEIVDRAILIMVNEAARCLEEHVVEGPEDLDMAMVMGTGFAPFRGGLLRYADERGIGQIKERLDELATEFGDRFKTAPLIERIAADGGNFHHQEAAPRV